MFETDFNAEFVEPICNKLIEIIERDVPTTVTQEKYNRGADMPKFAEVSDVRTNEPHYPYCIVQTSGTRITEQETVPESEDELHLITIWIGTQHDIKALATKMMYRYVRVVHHVVKKAKKKEIFEGIAKEHRAGLSVKFIAHTYGQATYEGTTYQYLASLTLAVSIKEN